MKPPRSVLLRSQENEKDMVAIFAVAGRYMVLHRWSKTRQRAGFTFSLPWNGKWLGSPFPELEGAEELENFVSLGSHFYEVTGQGRKIVALRPFLVAAVTPGFKGYIGSGEALGEMGGIFLWPSVEWPEKGAAETGLKEDAVAIQLAGSAGRLAALRRLISKAGVEMYSSGSLAMSSGSQRLDTYEQRAMSCIREAASPDLVMLALKSTDRTVRHWGIKNFGWTDHDDWKSSLPDLMVRAVLEPDFFLRAQVVSRLHDYPETRQFLQDRIDSDQETSPWVWLSLDFNAESPASHDRFNQRALKWLSSKDETIRGEWLSQIASNPSLAPVCRVRYGAEVAHRVQELFDHPASLKEKKAAERALMVFPDH
jgi:hypothetical protein